MLCRAEKREEFGEPNNRAGAQRIGQGDEQAGIYCGFGRAEGRRCGNALKDGSGGVLNVDFLSLRKSAVQGVDVAATGKCGADESEVAAWERGGGVIEREVFEREFDEEQERTYALTGNNRNGFGKEKILEEEEMGRKIGAKAVVCGDEVGEENAFAITDEGWLTGGGGEEEEGREMEEVAQMGFQWRTGLEPLRVFIVLRFAVDLRLQI